MITIFQMLETKTNIGSDQLHQKIHTMYTWHVVGVQLLYLNGQVNK